MRLHALIMPALGSTVHRRPYDPQSQRVAGRLRYPCHRCSRRRTVGQRTCGPHRRRVSRRDSSSRTCARLRRSRAARRCGNFEFWTKSLRTTHHKLQRMCPHARTWCRRCSERFRSAVYLDLSTFTRRVPIYALVAVTVANTARSLRSVGSGVRHRRRRPRALASVVIHELAHALTARRFACRRARSRYSCSAAWQPRRRAAEPAGRRARCAAGPAMSATVPCAYGAMHAVDWWSPSVCGRSSTILAYVTIAQRGARELQPDPAFPMDGGECCARSVAAAA